MGLLYAILLIAICLFHSPCLGHTQQYEPEDWISYTKLRYITSVTMDQEYIYFGTTGGVSRYDRYRERWVYPLTTSNGLPDNRVRRIAYDLTTGYLWVDTFAGVCRWRPTLKNCLVGGQFPERLAKRETKGYQSLNLFTEFGYTFHPEGYIEDRFFRRYYIRDFLEDGWGNLWFGTWGLNVGRADLTTSRLKMLRMGLLEEDVTAILMDGEEIWFGGTGGGEGSEGITRFNPRSGEWTYFEAGLVTGLPSDEVTCMAADSDYVWVGTQYGLSRYDKAKGEWSDLTTFKELSDDIVTALVIEGDTLWVGTVSGLNLLNRKGEFIEAVEVEGLKAAMVFDLASDGRYIWVSTETGVYRYDRANGKWEGFMAPPGYLEPVVIGVETDGPRVWFAVTGQTLGQEISVQLRWGRVKLDSALPTPVKTLTVPSFISVYDASTGEWQRYFPPAGLSSGPLLSLTVHEEGVWVGTPTGVLRFDQRKGTWRHFGREDGLIDDQVQAILGDGDYIWFGTPKGVTRFHWRDPFQIY